MVRQQGKLLAFIRFIMNTFRGGRRRLELRIKAQVESRRQTPNITPKCLGKLVMKEVAQMNFVRFFLGYQLASYGQSFIKQLSSHGVLKTFLSLSY